MVDKKDLSVISYTLGILSIVFAFFNSIAGLALGIIGFIQAKKQKDSLSVRAKKLNKIGIILSAIMLAISIAITAYFAIKGISTNFPFV